jgi:hypothetical protein
VQGYLTDRVPIEGIAGLSEFLDVLNLLVPSQFWVQFVNLGENLSSDVWEDVNSRLHSQRSHRYMKYFVLSRYYMAGAHCTLV